jgi:hypothetical protein
MAITDQNIAGAAPVVSITYSPGVGPAIDVTADLEPVGQSHEGNQFSFDPDSGLWVFNLGTKPFTAPGTYTVSAVAGDTAYEMLPECSGQFVRAP